MRRSRAFTLVEILVVIAIISFLVMIMIPAFLAGAGSARRIQCINNLKQVSLALLNYETVRGALPAGCWADSRPVKNSREGYQLSWVASILPSMEQAHIYSTINFRLGADSAANSTAFVTRINTLLCPSGARDLGDAPTGWFLRRTNRLNPGPTGKTSPGPGLTLYAACHHDVEAPIDVDNRGVMYLNSRVRFIDVTDGLSSTILLGEVQKASPLGWATGTRATLRNTGHPLNEEGAADADGKPAVSPEFVGGFGSFHQGDGANFGFCDGSVRFIKRTVARAVYEHLGNRQDGEPLDESDY
ncbi:DUF1559 domain-containing protein [Aquisphaera insulae]|uniref:DUF1559 domain-containing protein n=1 Tax=Aquisphaera insulae TaxID=2712864 RepID=UPI0013EBED41|nr:DUF1559 domain-containing protein [Aquisphaera insulae]